MKKFNLILLLFLVSFFSLAAGNGAMDNNMDQKLFDSKVKTMTDELSLTQSQLPKFIPIYQSYNKDMRAAYGKPPRHVEASTSAEAASQINARLNSSIRAITVQKKYINNLSKVLNPEQLTKFLRVENRIQHKLMDRRDRGAKNAGQRRWQQGKRQCGNGAPVNGNN